MSARTALSTLASVSHLAMHWQQLQCNAKSAPVPSQCTRGSRASILCVRLFGGRWLLLACAGEPLPLPQPPRQQHQQKGNQCFVAIELRQAFGREVHRTAHRFVALCHWHTARTQLEHALLGSIFQVLCHQSKTLEQIMVAGRFASRSQSLVAPIPARDASPGKVHGTEQQLKANVHPNIEPD